MKYEIITDRVEIDNLTEYIHYSGDTYANPIDYNDIRTVKKISSLKYGIKCKAECTEGRIDFDIIAVIKEAGIDIADIKTVMLGLRFNGSDPACNLDVIYSFLDQIYGKDSEKHPLVLWALSTNPDIQIGECLINIVYGFDKTA
jgi:hypothetical protein